MSVNAFCLLSAVGLLPSSREVDAGELEQVRERVRQLGQLVSVELGVSCFQRYVTHVEALKAAEQADLEVDLLQHVAVRLEGCELLWLNPLALRPRLVEHDAARVLVQLVTAETQARERVLDTRGAYAVVLLRRLRGRVAELIDRKSEQVGVQLVRELLQLEQRNVELAYSVNGVAKRVEKAWGSTILNNGVSQPAASAATAKGASQAGPSQVSDSPVLRALAICPDTFLSSRTSSPTPPPKPPAPKPVELVPKGLFARRGVDARAGVPGRDLAGELLRASARFSAICSRSVGMKVGMSLGGEQWSESAVRKDSAALNERGRKA